MRKLLCRALLAGCVATGAACQSSHYLQDPQYELSQYTETSTKEAVALGQRLFFDPQLSGSGRTACAACHNPDFVYGDPRPVSISDNGQPGYVMPHRCLTLDFDHTSCGMVVSLLLRNRLSVHSDRTVKWG